jgi:multimeric flavodoxin WrbA
MRVVVLSASPNTDGLTAACARAAVEAAAGVDAQKICLNGAGVGMCRACGNGWGTCQTEHSCQVEDGFQAIHRQVIDADALVLVTPVYWGEMSESAKAFTDRLRRCEASAGESSQLKDKPVIVVAAAGGSGGGLASCLGSMERLIMHLRARPFDLVSVNRLNRQSKIEAVRESVAAMIQGDGRGSRQGLRRIKLAILSSLWTLLTPGQRPHRLRASNPRRTPDEEAWAQPRHR